MTAPSALPPGEQQWAPPPTSRRIRNPNPDHAWYRLLGLPTLVTIATGLAPYATGAPISRAIGISLTFGVVSWLLVKSMTISAPSWPAPPETGTQWGRTPRQWEVPGLQSALTRPQYMSRGVLVQLRQLVTDLLARRGSTIDSPQARELLGDRVISLLTDPDTRPASRNELTAIIGLCTQLAVDATDGARPLPIPAALVVGQHQRRALFGRRADGKNIAAAHSGSTVNNSPAFTGSTNRRETR